MKIPRWLWLPTLLQAALALLLCFVPLFDLLGYEFALATALAAAITGPAIGLGAGRLKLSGPRALGLGLAASAVHLAPSLAIMSLNALRIRNCNFVVGLAFFALLPLASALYGAALGVLVARTLRPLGHGAQVAAAALVVFIPLAWALASLYRQPPIFAYDHLWGHFAGSLYDEQIRIGTPLLALRLGTLLRIAGVWALLATWERRRRGSANLVCSALVLGALALFESWVGPATGFRTSRAAIERELSVTVERPGLVLHVPASTDAKLREAIADDHAFRLWQISQRLQIEVPFTIHSFVYASAEDKARLMGGRATMITKPWLHEIHLHGLQVPHPVLGHEMVHVVAAAFGSRPFGVSARGWFAVDMGVVEGLAEAVGPDHDVLDLDEWTRAMQELHVAPDITEILGATGFWRQSAPRAYSAAGSFVRYLLTTYGPDPLKRAYPHADFSGAYGQSLAELVAGWQRHLEALTLSPRALHLAEERFRVPSIFQRTCAHEIASLREKAGRAAPADAVAIYHQMSQLLGAPPPAEYERALALERAGDDDRFLALSERLLSGPGLTLAQYSRLRETRGEILWAQSGYDEARSLFRRVLEDDVSIESDRLQWVRLWALDQAGALRDALQGLLVGKRAPLAATVELVQATTRLPRDRTLPYLIARQLFLVGDYAQALAFLDRAAEHPFAPIEAERVRLRAECLWQLTRLDAAAEAYASYERLALTSGERARARDMSERVSWQKARSEPDELGGNRGTESGRRESGGPR